jgi:hypothetical protein
LSDVLGAAARSPAAEPSTAGAAGVISASRSASGWKLRNAAHAVPRPHDPRGSQHHHSGSENHARLEPGVLTLHRSSRCSCALNLKKV